MHENNHQNQEDEKTDSTGKPYENLPGDMDEKPAETPAALVARFGSEMRQYALAHPALTVAEANETASSGKFSRLLNINPLWTIHVILTISPSTDESVLFWHCSMSIASRISGKPKSVELWVSSEKHVVHRLLPEFLGDAGDKETQHFRRTASAIHCARQLTGEELKLIDRKRS